MNGEKLRNVATTHEIRRCRKRFVFSFRLKVCGDTLLSHRDAGDKLFHTSGQPKATPNAAG